MLGRAGAGQPGREGAGGLKSGFLEEGAGLRTAGPRVGREPAFRALAPRPAPR